MGIAGGLLTLAFASVSSTQKSHDEEVYPISPEHGSCIITYKPGSDEEVIRAYIEHNDLVKFQASVAKDGRYSWMVKPDMRTKLRDKDWSEVANGTITVRPRKGQCEVRIGRAVTLYQISGVN